MIGFVDDKLRALASIQVSASRDGKRDEIEYYVDGVVVRTVENTHWHQPLFMIFDSETMPDWFGMPKDEDLPSTYSVEYVRAWNRQDERQ